MGRVKLYPGEKVLDDNETAFCGEWYLVNGKPYRSNYGGTIGYLKECLKAENEGYPNLAVEDIEVKYCNKFARRLS